MFNNDEGECTKWETAISFVRLPGGLPVTAGLAKCDSAPNALHFSAPSKFGGLEARWTPQDFMLAAVASCFTATFQILASRSRFDYLDLEVEVGGSFQQGDECYTFKQIVTRPTLTMLREDDHRQARALLNEAHSRSAVARMLSVSTMFEPRLQLASSRQLSSPQ